ncbi:MAG: hypothetical protein ACK4GO_17225 [Gemmobacter sp.]
MTQEALAGATGADQETAHQDNTTTRAKRKPTRQALWRQRNPAAYLAHLFVSNAVRLGVLERQPCAVCGADRAEAHHPDYQRPGLVTWLCRRHHAAAHKREGRS